MHAYQSIILSNAHCIIILLIIQIRDSRMLLLHFTTCSILARAITKDQQITIWREITPITSRFKCLRLARARACETRGCSRSSTLLVPSACTAQSEPMYAALYFSHKHTRSLTCKGTTVATPFIQVLHSAVKRACCFTARVWLRLQDP